MGDGQGLSGTHRIGSAGVWSNFDRLPADELVAFARAAEARGYHAFWTQESAGRDPFALLGHLAAHTERVRLGVGIAVIYGRDAVAMRAGAATVQELSGGRMVLGVGASHHDTVSEVRGHAYRRPLAAMREFLDAYERAIYRAPEPHGRALLVLAALRRRMLSLAATRADGAFPYLVPVEYVAQARRTLDEAAAAEGRRRPLLVVSQACLLEADAGVARAAARRYLDRYLGLPNYLNNLRELGFGDEDLAKPGSDRLVDALVSWGDETTVRARLRAMLDAGADHVALIPLTAAGAMADRRTMEALAPPW
ncbi:MAG TPA: TIGR03620 family F420-dependent LLM class oxidoreductase [candidate division Zixibacteria bacterium]|nr:TIGR03620 family F420-dependent LLM class oxidoreductase [candidate division Zixibacteria bacterium]